MKDPELFGKYGEFQEVIVKGNHHFTARFMNETQFFAALKDRDKYKFTDEQIKNIAKNLEEDLKKKYCWLFDQLTNTYGRDSIKVLTRFFVNKLGNQVRPPIEDKP